MKKFRLLACLHTLLLVSCGPEVSFEEPQPAGVKDLKSFPKSFRGEYQSKQDGSVLSISGSMITRTYEIYFTASLKNLDSVYEMRNGLLYDKTFNDSFPVIISGDSIYHHSQITDTLFMISPATALRKMKGYLFLNSRYSENNWTVEKVSLHKGVLRFAAVNSKEDIDLLNELVETKDTTTLSYKPSKKEFRKFVKQEGFSDTEEFTRVRR